MIVAMATSHCVFSDFFELTFKATEMSARSRNN
jgi:hypothetical protein